MLFDEQIQDYFRNKTLSTEEVHCQLKLKLIKLLKLLDEPKGVASICNTAVQVSCYLTALEIDLENTFNVNFNPYRQQLSLGLSEDNTLTSSPTHKD